MQHAWSWGDAIFIKCMCVSAYSAQCMPASLEFHAQQHGATPQGLSCGRESNHTAVFHSPKCRFPHGLERNVAQSRMHVNAISSCRYRLQLTAQLLHSRFHQWLVGG